MPVSFFVLLGFLTGCNTNPEKYRDFMEQLTFPDQEWSATDYGVLPTDVEKSLLKDEAPKYWIGVKECGPMDFYRQYAPLLEMEGRNPVDRSVLKKFERDFSKTYQLKEDPTCLQSSSPPLYSYLWRETMHLNAQQQIPVTILKYAFTFYKSGLPAKIGFFQGLGLLGSNDKWHYLDIHGAAFYLLHSDTQKPFALVLAQHNHFRTYIIGVDITSEQSKNICYSLRSNEPYVCEEEESTPRTAPSFVDMRWIVKGGSEPFLAGHDVVPGKKSRRAIDYSIEYLSGRDPLITSWISLGPSLKIWGMIPTFFRNAPPGMAIFNTPKLRDVNLTAQYFYFDPDDEETFKMHEQNVNDFLNPNVDPVLAKNKSRFVKRLDQLSGK